MRTKNPNEQFERDYIDRPCVHYRYKKRPSWKSYGDGVAIVEMALEHTGELSIKACEFPEGMRGGKEVFVTLSKEKAQELLALLQSQNERTGE